MSTRVYNLENGTGVALQETPTDTIASKFRINAGSRDEREDEDGLAHLLEHVLVNSPTKTYSFHDAMDIQETVGNFNAATSPTHTEFTAGMLSEDFDKFLAYVDEAIFEPELREVSLQKEKRRVIQEISQKLANPAIDAWKQYLEKIYGEGSPHVELNIRGNLGSAESVKSFTVDDLEQLHNREYHAGNLDILLVGDLPEGLDKRIEKQFGERTGRERNQQDFPRNPPIDERVISRTPAPERRQGENSSAYLRMDFNAPTEDEDGYYEMIILDNLLSGGRSPLLFEKLSRERGVAYDISSDYINDFNRGLLSVEGNVDAERLDESVEGVVSVFRDIKSEGVSDNRLRKIKHKLEYSMKTQYQTNSGKLMKMESSIDKGRTVDEHLEMLYDVTTKDVRELTTKFLPDHPNDQNYGIFIRDPLL